MAGLHRQCCIVGAGPAGMMLALLLARKGVSVELLEVHQDLDRDFRGDTVHASTLEILDQIGLADGILELPHAKMHELSVNTLDGRVVAISFQRLDTRFPYIAMMPQHLFLNRLLEEARRYENFHMRFGCGVTALCTRDDRVTGVCTTRDQEIHADLVVAADGRFSRMRRLAGAEADTQAPPMDVAWLRLERHPGDPESGGAFYIVDGRICVLLMREHEWQIGYVFPKGDFAELQKSGIATVKQNIASVVPWLADRVRQIESFDDMHLLKVNGDRLRSWYRPGLLFIGDAAHVMTPVGGVGINYAISDAVEAANLLLPSFLRREMIGEELLHAVQVRREKAVKMIQRVQALIQNRIVDQALKGGRFKLPLTARLLLKTPFLRDLPPRVVAFGLKRVRIQDP